MAENAYLSRKNAVVYFFLCFLLWVAVDFGTAGGFRLSYFAKYGFTLLLFYIGYPLIFSLLVFRFRWGERRLFFATCVGIFIVEVLFTHNPIVMSFPVCLAGIPLAIAVYAPLTYFPLWIVRKQVCAHLGWVLFLSAAEIIVTFLSVFGSGGAIG